MELSEVKFLSKDWQVSSPQSGNLNTSWEDQYRERTDDVQLSLCIGNTGVCRSAQIVQANVTLDQENIDKEGYLLSIT